MARSQREKGKRNERLAARAVQRVLGIAACRTAQNTGMNGLADIDMGARFHCEVKVRKSIAACRYYDQALRDQKPGTVPMVLMREDRGEWMIMLTLEDIPELIEAVNDEQRRQVEHDDPSGATDRSDRGDRSGAPDDRTT